MRLSALTCSVFSLFFRRFFVREIIDTVAIATPEAMTMLVAIAEPR
jgi:hypothetical protein